MPSQILSSLVAALRQHVAAYHTDTTPSDAWLLHRFLTHCDQQAFAALVRRHGPLVLAVCRRVTGDLHLAEDAFQAAFLVLARRAADVRPPAAVRAWLYGVAVRTAREAHKQAVRRRSREVPMPLLPDRPAPTPVSADCDTLRILDKEIARLPEHLRSAVILCELDGVPRKKAAGLLGIPEGTLSSRLAKARKLLAERLQGQGVTLSLGALALRFNWALSAARVRDVLMTTTIQLAQSGPIPVLVAELSRKVFRMMLWNKLKMMTLVFTLVAAVSGGVLTHVPALAWPDDSQAKPVAASRALPAHTHTGHILYSRDGALFLMNPDGANERRIELPPEAAAVTCLSPDGQQLAFWTEGDNEQPVLCVRALDGRGFGTRIELKEKCGFIQFFWAANGREIQVNLGGPTDPEVRHLLVDIKSKQITRLKALKSYLLTDQTADGKYFLATSVGNGAEWQPKSIHFKTREGTEFKLLADPTGWAMSEKLSPDGKRAMLMHDGKPCVLELDKPGVLKPVGGIPEDAEVTACAWAPDGKRLVYVIGKSRPLVAEELQKLESRLVVADVDGGNAKVLRSEKGKLITGVDWR